MRGVLNPFFFKDVLVIDAKKAGMQVLGLVCNYF